MLYQLGDILISRLFPCLYLLMIDTDTDVDNSWLAAYIPPHLYSPASDEVRRLMKREMAASSMWDSEYTLKYSSLYFHFQFDLSYINTTLTLKYFVFHI